jgi:chromosome segregation ATPase
MEIMSVKHGESTKRIENLNNEMMNISVENKATYQKSVEFTGNIHHLKEQNDKLMGDLNRYSNEIKALNSRISEQELKLDEKNSAVVSKDNQINELKTMLIEFENLNNQIEGKLTSMKYTESDLGKLNQELRNQVMQLERELKDSQGK